MNLLHDLVSLSKIKLDRLFLEAPIDRSITRQHCPCCSNVLLRHIRPSGIYWRCSHCWQDLPLISIEN
jgi:hypothetical protein